MRSLLVYSSTARAARVRCLGQSEAYLSPKINNSVENHNPSVYLTVFILAWLAYQLLIRL